MYCVSLGIHDVCIPSLFNGAKFCFLSFLDDERRTRKTYSNRRARLFGGWWEEESKKMRMKTSIVVDSRDTDIGRLLKRKGERGEEKNRKTSPFAGRKKFEREKPGKFKDIERIKKRNSMYFLVNDHPRNTHTNVRYVLFLEWRRKMIFFSLLLNTFYWFWKSLHAKQVSNISQLTPNRLVVTSREFSSRKNLFLFSEIWKFSFRAYCVYMYMCA